jgi:hypothetical protein
MLALLLSSVASAATVAPVKSVDGYQADSTTVYFAVSSQEHEGDEPDELLTDTHVVVRRQVSTRIGLPQGKAVAFYYQDYQARAPPQLL